MNDNWVYIMFGFTWLLWKFQISFPFFFFFNFFFFFYYYFKSSAYIYMCVCARALDSLSCLGSHGYCEKSHFPFFLFFIIYLFYFKSSAYVYIYIYIYMCVCARARGRAWLSSIVPARLEIVQSFNPRLRFKDPVNLES